MLLLVMLQLYGSLPDREATVKVRDVTERVAITRDAYGIPSIEAKSDRDAFFAMGYVQAQDRMWQLEFQRLLVCGTLSSVVGRDAVSSDVLMRTLGLRRAARLAWPHLGQHAQDALQAFADGVNAWLEQGEPLPLEFVALGHRPQPWQPIDSIALMKLFAFSLAVGYGREMERQMALSLLPSKHFNSRYPGVPASTASAGLSTAALDAANAIHQRLTAELSLTGANPGSNAWVVSGQLTHSGFPILANDPHLGLQIPSLWYAATLRGAKLYASGMTLPGLPIILLGRNANIAWGATNLLADTQDLGIERLGPRSPKTYLYQGRWHPFSTREEVINIAADFPQSLRRAIKPLRIQVRSSLNGPVVTDVRSIGDGTLTLRWTGLDEVDTSFEAFLRVNYATDWPAFRAALSLLVAPTLDVLYADRLGNIGHSAAGRIPVRDEGQGMLPMSAASVRWLGYIPWSEMPHSFNPPSGVIVSANNRWVDERFPYFISNDWADSARAERIGQLLDARTDAGQSFDTDFFQQMQTDVVDLNAVRVVKLLKDRYPGSMREDVVAAFEGWNGDMHADSAATVLYTGILRHLRRALYADEFDLYYSAEIEKSDTASMIDGATARDVIKALTVDTFWCDDLGTVPVEGCDAIVAAATRAASKELRRVAGRWPGNWRWGKLNTRVYEHKPFSRVDLFRRFFSREVAGDGTPDTISASGSYFDRSRGYVQSYGSGFRQVIELTQPVRHLAVNSTGESGNILSRHYDDAVWLMQNNAAVELGGTADRGTTTLLPRETR